MPRLACAVIVLAGLGMGACGPDEVKPPSDATRRALSSGETRWVTANGLRLKTKVYRSRAARDATALVVVLHGDSPIGRPSIQYQFAQSAAERLDAVITVGVLRPGYTDGAGETSGGVRGRATGDNYTP